MPVIEYIKDSKHESSGRKIPKGSQHTVTRERARELEEKEMVVVVGSKSNKAVQDRTRAINNLQREQAAPGPAVSTDMSAVDAVRHIENTKKADLKGFVTDQEDRKTVLEAWESK